MKTHPRKVGIVFGAVFGGVHFLWSVLVALGWAQALADFSTWAHMVHFKFTAGPFDMSAAITLVVVATCIGYGVGYAGATVWNRVHA